MHQTTSNRELSLNDSFIALDRASSHPNPAYDFLTGFTPRKLKDLFKWCEYLAYNSAQIYSTLQKFGDLVVTEIEYGTANEALRNKYKNLFEKRLKVKGALLAASLDRNVYGNHFTSIYTPFIRYLKCRSCTHLMNIKEINYRFVLKKLEFHYRCRKCRKTTTGSIVDKKVVDVSRIHIIRWDPKQMDIDYNPITGESVYYYTIPEEIKAQVRQGSKHLINTMPREFLETIRDGKEFRFREGAIKHIKTPSPSGVQQQWGLPSLVAAIKLFLYTMILRKANEAIALEHIVPFRILHPVQSSGQDFTQMINLSRWQEELKVNMRQWRRDPLHAMFSPVPVGVSNVGGEGRALLTLGELQEADKSTLAGMGVPTEFVYGGLSKAGMEGSLRLIENQLQSNADDMNEILQWYGDSVGKFLGWEPIPTTLTPMRMVDDTETKQQLFNLSMPGPGGEPPVVSRTTLAERLGVDPHAEEKKRMQEALDTIKYEAELQQKVMEMQSTLAQQVQQQVQGLHGLSYDQQAVVGQADALVNELMGLEHGERRSALHNLKNEDFVMYSVVVRRLEDARRMQTQQNASDVGGAQEIF